MTVLLQIVTDSAIVVAADAKTVHFGEPASGGLPLEKMIAISAGRVVVESCGPGRMEFEHPANADLGLKSVSYSYSFSVLMRGRTWNSDPSEVAIELAAAADETFADLESQRDWEVSDLIAQAANGAPFLVRYIVVGYDSEPRPKLFQVEVPFLSNQQIGPARVSAVLEKPFPAGRLAVECTAAAADQILNQPGTGPYVAFRRRAPRIFSKIMADRNLTVREAKRAATMFVQFQAWATPNNVGMPAEIMVLPKPAPK